MTRNKQKDANRKNKAQIELHCPFVLFILSSFGSRGDGSVYKSFNKEIENTTLFILFNSVLNLSPALEVVVVELYMSSYNNLKGMELSLYLKHLSRQWSWLLVGQ